MYNFGVVVVLLSLIQGSYAPCSITNEAGESDPLPDCITKYFTDDDNKVMMDGNVGVECTERGSTRDCGTCSKRADSSGNLLSPYISLARARAEAIYMWEEQKDRNKNKNCRGEASALRSQAEGTEEDDDWSTQIESVFSFEENYDADYHLLITNGIPNHCYQTGHEFQNNHKVKEHWRAIFIPRVSGPPSTKSLVDGSGVQMFMLSGAFTYKHTSSSTYCNSAGIAEKSFQDACDGHADANNIYHHHKMPNCQSDDTLSSINQWGNCEHVGWSPDGYKLYSYCEVKKDNGDGTYGDSFVLSSCHHRNDTFNGCDTDHYYFQESLNDCYLDEGNGYEFSGDHVAADDTSKSFPDGTYAYFFTPKYPFLPMGRMVEVDKENWCQIDLADALTRFDENGNEV